MKSLTTFASTVYRNNNFFLISKKQITDLLSTHLPIINVALLTYTVVDVTNRDASCFL